jgi:hypothetical protein
MNSEQASNEGYVVLWHYSDAPRLLPVGLQSGALPTLGIEGRFSAALQTWRREVAKVGT